MIDAALKHKLPEEVVQSEDFLTSVIFGMLKHKAFHHILKAFLAKATLLGHPQTIFISEMKKSGFASEEIKVALWERYNEYGEPDLILESRSAAIVIEVKFGAGLSGEEQLRKYYALLTKRYPLKNHRHIIFLTADLTHPELTSNMTHGIESNLWWLSWYDLEGLLHKHLNSSDPLMSQIIKDLINFLHQQKLDLFKGFSLNIEPFLPESFFWDGTIPLITGSTDFFDSANLFWQEKIS